MTLRDDIKAWRELLPDWRPTLGQLQRLDAGPPEFLAALRSVARGWSPDDARWDVLMALFEYTRREVREQVATEIEELDRQEPDDWKRPQAWLDGFSDGVAACVEKIRGEGR